MNDVQAVLFTVLVLLAGDYLIDKVSDFIAKARSTKAAVVKANRGTILYGFMAEASELEITFRTIETAASMVDDLSVGIYVDGPDAIIYAHDSVFGFDINGPTRLTLTSEYQYSAPLMEAAEALNVEWSQPEWMVVIE